MFNFRLINTPDGNQIIDTKLSTPYNSLTPLQMQEYIEVDEKLTTMKRIENRSRIKRINHKFLQKIACFCGTILHIV